MAAPECPELQKTALEYFSHVNYISKRIVTQDKTFKKHIGSRWSELPAQHRDALLNLLFVNDDVREYYSNDNRYKRPEDVSSMVQESFPRLYINSGNKINVDFENDLWTWRDEHSGPFSWMSRSQQDLTLQDLEPDNILKPQPKTLKVDTEDEKSLTRAQPQFTYPSSSWCHSIIDEFKKNEENIVLTPAASMNVIGVTTGSTEDSGISSNPDDISLSSSPVHGVTHVTDPDMKNSAPEVARKPSVKDRSKKSPSPKKILRGGSFKKSSLKNGEQKLISCDDTEMETRSNAFSNPIMESEWSTFVGHSNVEDLHSSKMQESPIMSAPESLNMDRGSYQEPNSPNVGDNVCLIEATDSPAQASLKPAASPDVSEWSIQSTPDQTTHLLKGIQSPVHHKSTKIQTIDMGGYGKELPGEDVEEVLIVEKEGDKIIVTTKVENKRDSDIPTTGFDFLDNW